MKKLIAIAVSGAFALALAGCNTIQGAGKDIERGGEKIQDASIKVRNDWRAARDKNDRDYEAARGSCTTGTDAQRDACRDKARADYRQMLLDIYTTSINSDHLGENDAVNGCKLAEAMLLNLRGHVDDVSSSARSLKLPLT